MKHFWRGVAYALTAAVLFGASIPLSKLLLSSVEPWMLSGLLDLGAGAGLAGLQFCRNLWGFPGSETGLRREDLPWMIAAIAAGGVFGTLLLILGLVRIDAATGSLLLNLEGIGAMAIAWIVFREKANRRIVLGALAIVAGAAVLSWPGQGVALDFGAVLVAGACLAWAIDNNIVRKISACDPTQITIVRGLAAGTIILVLAFARGATLPAAPFIAAALALGFVGYGISWALIVLSLRHLGTARTAAYFSTTPFIGAAVAVALLGEPVSTPLVIGGLLMAVGIWIHATEKRPHALILEPMVREPAGDEHGHRHGAQHGYGEHSQGPMGSMPESHFHPDSSGHVGAPPEHRHPHHPDARHRHDGD